MTQIRRRGIQCIRPGKPSRMGRNFALNSVEQANKMKRVWIALILSIAPVVVWAGTGPRIAFDQLTQDVGKIAYGGAAKTSFFFTNKGDDTLIIKSVSADCGCTKALLGRREIPPNAKGEVVASFDTEGLKAGRKEKHVYVASNDAKRPEVKLTLVAEVVKDLEADPLSLTKKLEKFEETVSFPVKVANSSAAAHTITGLKSLQGEANVTMKPEHVTVPPGQTVPLEIVVNLAPKVHQPFWLGKVLLETDHPHEREIEIRYLIQTTKPN